MKKLLLVMFFVMAAYSLTAYTLTVTSSPSGASIFCNNLPVGVSTPYTFSAAAFQPGVYTVRLQSYGWTPASFTVTLLTSNRTIDFHGTPPDEYEPDDVSGTCTSLTISETDQTQTHTLHSSTDNDWYIFFGMAGRTYVFYSTGNTDTFVQLFRNDGTTELASDNESGGNGNYRLEYTPSISDYYRLRVLSLIGELGIYVFHYSFYIVPDSYEPDNSATEYTDINVASIEQLQNHNLHSSTDQDWYKFYGRSGVIYDFSSTGTTDPVIYLYQDDGITLLGSNDDEIPGYILNFHLQFTLSSSAYYKIKVIGCDGALGDYVLQYFFFVEPDSFEPDDSPSACTAINVTALNQTQNHTLHNSADQDWYRFYGEVGRYYDFYSTGNTDTYVVLYTDDGGTVLASNDDGGGSLNFRLRFAPVASAYYKLKVIGYFGALGSYVFNYSHTLAAPKNVTLGTFGSGLVIQWNAHPFATSYIIQSSNNPYTGFTPATTTNTTFWFTNATSARKFYRVIAVE